MITRSVERQRELTELNALLAERGRARSMVNCQKAPRAHKGVKPACSGHREGNRSLSSKVVQHFNSLSRDSRSQIPPWGTDPNNSPGNTLVITNWTFDKNTWTWYTINATPRMGLRN